MFELMVKSRSKQLKKLKKNEKGFTLVELIVVVAILGILAAIGISRFAGMTDNAREKADLSTAATIASATQAWIADQDKKVEDSDIGSDFIEDELVDKGYMEKPRKARTNGEDWIVNYKSDGNVLEVKAGERTFYPSEEPSDS